MKHTFGNAAVGAAAVVAADTIAPNLPASIDIASLPLRYVGVGLGAAYGVGKLVHRKSDRAFNLMHSAIYALTALAVAELSSKVTAADYTLGPVSVKRTLAGAAGVAGIGYFFR